MQGDGKLGFSPELCSEPPQKWFGLFSTGFDWIFLNLSLFIT